MRKAMPWLWLLGAWLLALLAFAPLVRQPWWWIRGLDFPRLQLLVVAVVWLLLGLLLRRPWPWSRRLAALALGVGVGLVAWEVHRYTPLAPLQAPAAGEAVPADRTFTLLIANVLQDNRDADPLLDLVRAEDPDLLLLVETDAWWTQQVRQLAGRLPHALERPQANTYGMVLRSKLPLHGPRVRTLIEPDIPSLVTQVELRSGDRFDLYGLHPRPPPEGDTDERDAELLLVGREVARHRRPAIVAGDLNDVAWSHTTRLFLRTSRLLDPRIGRGLFATFPESCAPCRFPLDHVFVSRDFRVVAMAVLPGFGSDHLAVRIRLAFVPHQAAEVARPRASPQDRQEATRKIREGKRQEPESLPPPR